MARQAARRGAAGRCLAHTFIKGATARLSRCRRYASLAGAIWLAAIAACAAEPSPWLPAEGLQARRVPAIVDLIETTRVFTPRGAEPFVYSPDGRWAAYIESRPDTSELLVHYTLKVFDLQAVDIYLRERGTPPAPKLLYSSASRSAAPGLDQLRWSLDRLALTFVAQTGDGSSHIMEATLDGAVTVKISEPLPIVAYDTSAGAWSYLLLDPIRSERPDDREHVVSRSMNEEFGVHYLDGRLITVFQDATGRRRVVPEPSVPAFDAPLFSIWMSPDGRRAVGLRQATRIPVAWEQYRHSLPDEGLTQASGENPDEIGTSVVQYVLIDPEVGAVRRLLDAPVGNAAFGNAGPKAAFWTEDGHSVVLVNTAVPLQDGAPEWADQHAAIVVVDIDSGRYQPVFRLPRLEFTGPMTRIQSVSRMPGAGMRLLLRGVTRGTDSRTTPFTMTVTPGGVGQAWRADSSELPETPTLEVTEDLTAPPWISVRSRRFPAPVRLVELNPQYARLVFGAASVVEWRDRAGREWRAGLVLPQSYQPARKYPLVIQTHGFDEHQFLLDGPLASGYAAQALAGRDMAVVQFPDRPELYGRADEATAMVEGFRSLIAELDTRGLIRPDKVGLMGFSRTCYYVKQALVTGGIHIAAASVIDGIDNGYWQYLAGFGILANGYARSAEALYGGPPWGPAASSWIRDAPGFHLDRVQAPVRIVGVGLKSLRAEWEWYAGLRLLGKPVDFVLTPTDRHELVRPASKLVAAGGNLDWFDFWLNGHEDADPTKAAQYRRWRNLRALRPRAIESAPNSSAN